MAVNSALISVRWLLVMVPVADSVASETARVNRLVTCASEPSATCSLPMPSFALREDWSSAVMLACSPSASARPAASSAPLLMRDPEDNRNSVFCSPAWVMLNWLCAAIADALFKILIDISVLLLVPLGFLLRLLGRRSGTLLHSLHRRPLFPLEEIAH